MFKDKLNGEDRPPQLQSDLSPEQRLAKLKALYSAAFRVLELIWGDVEIMDQLIHVWHEFPQVLAAILPDTQHAPQATLSAAQEPEAY